MKNFTDDSLKDLDNKLDEIHALILGFAIQIATEQRKKVIDVITMRKAYKKVLKRKK